METASRSPERHISIYSGCEQNICHIFPEHFQFQSLEGNCPQQKICCSCLKALKDVHQFYERITAAGSKLQLQHAHITAHVENDPLPHDVQVQCYEIFNTGNLAEINNPVEPEIKLEFEDLDLLPKIEIIEETPPAQSERSQRARRRRLDAQDCATELPNAGKSNETKRRRCEIAKKEENGANLGSVVRNDAYQVMDNAVVIEAPSLAPEAPKRCRGRPKKVVITEADVTKDWIAATVTETERKTIEPNVTSDLESDNDFSADCINTADSDSESSHSNKSLSDLEPNRRCAVARKRNVGKSKNPEKRPRAPTKTRMTREEIEQRYAQKREYDRVIKQFFGNISCPKCNLVVETFDDLHIHLRKAHDEKFGFMNCCGRKFNSRRTLAEHVYVHDNPEYFKCTKCEKALPDRYALRMHELSHTNVIKPKEKKLFHCDKCPKAFAKKERLEDHTYSKHVPKSEFRFPCPHCDKRLPTNRRLKAHMKFMHDPEGAIICDKCGKKVRSQGCLKKHHEIEHPDAPRPTPTPMKCEICGTWYRHLTGLKNHMKSIHDDSGVEHRCSLCNHVSVNARALGRHIYHMHQCGRKFKCTMCEKAFKRPQDLREHTSVHTGEALYLCKNCPLTFVSKANYYKHRKRLHPVEWEADRCKPNTISMTQ